VGNIYVIYQGSAAIVQAQAQVKVILMGALLFFFCIYYYITEQVNVTCSGAIDIAEEMVNKECLTFVLHTFVVICY